jgi:dTDP-4-dehydrorhamnose 3,5-epimerase
MNHETFPTEGVYLFSPNIYKDDRGSFVESFNKNVFSEHVDGYFEFVQDNQSVSKAGVLRGLHFQINHPQGKLVRVSRGSVFDVAVDLRRSSPSFGQWVGVTLTEENQSQLWIPPGFAHGFYALTEHVTVQYKVTDFWYPEHERTLIWNDPSVGIKWPLVDNQPLLSEKDARGLPLSELEGFE